MESIKNIHASSYLRSCIHNVKSKFSVDMCFVNDEHDCTFCICMRSDKLRHERKMIRELRYQGLLHIEDSAFLKSQRVLADLCNHTGLEVSFHWV